MGSARGLVLPAAGPPASQLGGSLGKQRAGLPADVADQLASGSAEASASAVVVAKAPPIRSIYRGVLYKPYKPYGKWRAVVRVNGGEEHVGYFEEEAEAARAVDRAVIRHPGA
jgi:hypothetical protein